MRLQLLGFILVILVACGNATAQELGGDAGRITLERISRVVKAPLEGLTALDVHRLMAARYRNLRLLDDKECWNVTELVAHSAELLPDRLDGKALQRFVDVMADAAATNPYLMAFLEKASTCGCSRLEASVRAEGAVVFPDLVAHAEVLERLTALMSADFRISEACRAHWWRVADSDPRFWKAQSLFARLKTKSVNLGIDKFNSSHREGKVAPRTLALTLPLNILEAVGAELWLAVTGSKETRSGHLANARAGLALVWNGPHGAGPAKFSADGALVALSPKSVTSWNDLYVTWNMSFITIIGSWPYFLAKLVIPSVNDYQEDPGTYINRRALALGIQMYANGLERMDGTQRPMDWTDSKLGAVWGSVNLESARDYAAKARAASPRSSMLTVPGHGPLIQLNTN